MTTPTEILADLIVAPGQGISKAELLAPFIRQGFFEGWSENMLYSEIKGTALGMRRADFLKIATPLYDELRQASQVSLLKADDTFLIKDLVQKKASLEDRFWATVRIDYNLPNGEADYKYLTYGFGEKKSIADLEEDILNAWYGYYIAPEALDVQVKLETLYKQY